MTSAGSTYTVHSEARGPHWIAWVTEGAETKPAGSVVLVAATQEEAEERARRWADSRQA
jgi:hypothetical protein